jgi:hypothetical protein
MSTIETELIWYEQNAAPYLEPILREFDVRSVIEIGSFHGASAIWFAGHSRVERVTCIDPFEVSRYDPWWRELRDKGLSNPYWEEFRSNIQWSGVSDKIYAIRGYSYNVRSQVAPAELVYIDGDHSYGGCKLDIELYRDVAIKVIAGDDYQLRGDGQPDFPGVRRAVAELLPGHKSNGRAWWNAV